MTREPEDRQENAKKCVLSQMCPGSSNDTLSVHIMPNQGRSDIHPLRKVHCSAAKGSGMEALRVAPAALPRGAGVAPEDEIRVEGYQVFLPLL
jgi:hypothetical protein